MEDYYQRLEENFKEKIISKAKSLHEENQVYIILFSVKRNNSLNYRNSSVGLKLNNIEMEHGASPRKE